MTEIDFAKVKVDFDRDGFVVLRNYLNQDEVAELKDRAVPLAEKLLETEGGMGKYRHLLKSLHRHDDWFRQQLTDGKHVPLISYLIGGDAFGMSAAWFDRPEGEADGIGPHVDALGRSEYPSNGATIWYALDPVNEENGCLHYLAGSHRNDYPDVIPIPGIDNDSDGAVTADLNAGDAVIHSARTVHWSGGNESGQPRRAVSYFYFEARVNAALHPDEED